MDATMMEKDTSASILQLNTDHTKDTKEISKQNPGTEKTCISDLHSEKTDQIHTETITNTDNTTMIAKESDTVEIDGTDSTSHHINTHKANANTNAPIDKNLQTQSERVENADTVMKPSKQQLDTKKINNAMTAAIEEIKTKSRKRKSIPHKSANHQGIIETQQCTVQTINIPIGLEIKRSLRFKTEFGVFATSPLKSGSKFGPYEERKVAEALQAGRVNQNINIQSNGFKKGSSCWFIYVNGSVNGTDQNLVAFKHDKQIYYSVCKNVKRGEELLVWYGGVAIETSNEITATNREKQKFQDTDFKCKYCDRSYTDKLDVETHVKYCQKVPKDDDKHNSGDEGSTEEILEDEEEKDNKIPKTEDDSESEIDENDVIKDPLFTPPEKKHHCQECGKGFYFSSHLKLHLRKHSGETPHKCTICGKGFTRANSLKIHIRRHTGEKPFKCEYEDCGKAFPTSSSYQRHVRTHTGEKPYECEECGKTFVASNNLQRHQWIHMGLKPFKCDICDKAFNQMSSLNSHRRIHTGEKPFKCEVCGLEFSVSSNLQRHAKTHGNEKPHQCEFCDKAFLRSSDLQRHVRTHTGEKPYKCDVCGLTFGSLGNAQRHHRIHTGEKPYKCDICGKAFIQSGDLKRHLKTHDEKLYNCTVCGEKFDRSTALKTHTCSGPKPYSCENCTQTFNQPLDLQTHQCQPTQTTSDVNKNTASCHTILPVSVTPTMTQVLSPEINTSYQTNSLTIQPQSGATNELTCQETMVNHTEPSITNTQHYNRTVTPNNGDEDTNRIDFDVTRANNNNYTTLTSENTHHNTFATSQRAATPIFDQAVSRSDSSANVSFEQPTDPQLLERPTSATFERLDNLTHNQQQRQVISLNQLRQSHFDRSSSNSNFEIERPSLNTSFEQQSTAPQQRQSYLERNPSNSNPIFDINRSTYEPQSTSQQRPAAISLNQLRQSHQERVLSNSVFNQLNYRTQRISGELSSNLPGKRFIDVSHQQANRFNNVLSPTDPVPRYLDHNKPQISIYEPLQSQNLANSDRLLLPCNSCGLTFTHPTEFRNHTCEFRRDTPSYHCSACGMTFNLASELQTHHCSYRERSHRCGACGLTFNQLVDLQMHDCSYRQQKPYKCYPCGASFNHPTDLELHNCIARREKMYKCSFCGLSFDEIESLHNHFCTQQQHTTSHYQT